MLDGSTIVKSAVPGDTTSPSDTDRMLTTPVNGARIEFRFLSSLLE
jgi:hypothetical protein